MYAPIRPAEMKLRGIDVLGKIPNFLEGGRERGCQLIEFCDFPPKSEFTSLLNNYLQKRKSSEIKYSPGHS